MRSLQRVLALAVLLVQCALPIAPVFASEEVTDSTTPPVVTEVVSETSDAPLQTEEIAVQSEEALPPAQTTNELSESETVVSEPIGEVVVIEEDTSLTASTTETSTEEETSISEIIESSEETSVSDETSGEQSISSTTEEMAVDTETGSTTPLTIDVIDTIQSEIASTTEEVIPTEDTSTLTTDNAEVVVVQDLNNDAVLGIATTTEKVTVVQPENHVVINDNNRFSFSEQECARVGDGSFYCSTEKATSTQTGINRVFAAPDSDGDQEIYIEFDGVLTQVTFNQTDDSAPYYDERLDSLVWHRLVNERYQIVSYDVQSREEKVLTADRYNNMQPSRSGDITVWQGWVGNDWEIMLDYQGELTMLTDNTVHDIGPRVNGDYIIWQSFENDVWKAKIYNIRTKEIETIADTEGTSVENPRFVLVYDAKSESGDVETRGYDLLTGTNIPLSSRPTPSPSDIPDPDQTGEDRALITGNTQIKTKTDDENGDPDMTGSDIPPLDTSGTTILSGDLVIPVFESVSENAENTLSSTTAEAIPDIVIPQAEIILPLPDLVVPPYEATDTEPVLPQSEVAEAE